MQQTPPVYSGWLTTNGQRVEVQASYASRYSLWVDIDGVAAGEVENLELSVGDRLIPVGPCRVLPEQRSDGPERRVVPMERIHNFEKLYFHSKIETLESAVINLSLILGYKTSIDPAFRAFVSDLTYDLNVYINMLDQMDADCRDEPPSVLHAIQASIIEGAGTGLRAYLDAQKSRLDAVVAGFTAQEHEHHGFYFRRQLWNILLRAPIMARTNLKPRGYNGDSEMMRMIYMNDFQGDSTFGKIMHKYSIEQPAAQAVRNRRHVVADMLHSAIARCEVPATERLRVLSVACGPAFEVRDILRTSADCARIHISLFDQDQQALLEAAGLVSEIEKTLHTEISADFIRESVRTMLVGRALQERWGQFHFIYSMGLFDYLTAPVASAVLRKLYQLLKPDGEMVIGNFATGSPSRTFMEYWHDWKIIYRTEDDFLRLAEGLPEAEVHVHYDETRIQMLLQVKKRTHNGT